MIYIYTSSYKVKMSFERLLSGRVSEDRKLFVRKVHKEMYVNADVNMRDRESRKAYFLQLVEGNEELSEIEKRYCRERYIYHFELQNAMYEWGEPNTWTSGNEIIDDFIHQCQILSSLPNRILEWVPFDQFEEVTKLTE